MIAMMLVFGQWFDHLRIHPFKTDIISPNKKSDPRIRICQVTFKLFPGMFQ